MHNPKLPNMRLVLLLTVCPRFWNAAAAHPPVCSQSPLIRTFWPVQGPSPSPTPLYLARTPRVHHTLLQVMHNLCTSQATAAQAIQVNEATPSP